MYDTVRICACGLVIFIFRIYVSCCFVLQVFLTKHYRNRRADAPDFFLDFEEIYVIDSKTRSITRAKVVVRYSASSSIYTIQTILLLTYLGFTRCVLKNFGVSLPLFNDV